MTGVGAVPAGVPMPREGVATALTEAQEGPSFADWLDARQERRPFGNGTMHASVDAFAAGGMITVTAPVSQAAEVVTDTVAGLVAAPLGTAATVAGVAAVDDRRVADAVATPAEAGRGLATAVGSPHDAPVPSQVSGRVVSGALATAPPVAAPRAAVMLPELDAPEPVARPAARPARDRATAALTVTLEADATGAVVAINGDAAPDDEAALLRAVTRLLAQHGLTLDELRVARRPAHDGKEQGKR